MLNKTVGFQFLNASAWNDNNGAIDSMADMPLRHATSSTWPCTPSASAAWYTKILRPATWASPTWPSPLWWMALSYLAFPRILFAWGMDRMGPKWFTDINPRWASPVKNYILCFVLGEALLVLYYTLLHEHDAEHHRHRHAGDLGVHPHGDRRPALPLRRSGPRASGIRRRTRRGSSSACRSWSGAPLVDLVYLGILLYYFIFNAAAKQFTGPSTSSCSSACGCSASSGTSSGSSRSKASPASTSRRHLRRAAA